jgi:hypothetical protein
METGAGWMDAGQQRKDYFNFQEGVIQAGISFFFTRTAA